MVNTTSMVSIEAGRINYILLSNPCLYSDHARWVPAGPRPLLDFPYTCKQSFVLGILHLWIRERGDGEGAVGEETGYMLRRRRKRGGLLFLLQKEV